MERYTLHLGDCLESLRKIPEKSVHCCVTSPPYFGLRDYGLPPTDWPAIRFTTMPGLPTVDIPSMRCCLGMEPEPLAFIGHMVVVFREVRRVLVDDGTCWVNMGDSYASKPNGPLGAGAHANKKPHVAVRTAHARRSSHIPVGLKHKDLMGIPWRLAFALQDDGWYLRQDIIWHKPNPMPESVKDRCTKAHEYIFMLSKSPRYYFDAEAIKEPVAASTVERLAQPTLADQIGSDRVPGKNNGNMKAVGDGEMRNKRSVWTVTTKPFKGAHFATFPPDLIEPCILAGCPVGGAVLDPFGGSGTTAGVALANGRNAVLCELNPEYAELVPSRVDSILAKYGRSHANDNAPAPAQAGDLFAAEG